MTNLLIAALAMVPVTNAEWELKNPFKEKLKQEYEVLIVIDAGGMDMEVEILSELVIKKKSDKGFSGTFGFSEIYVDGEPQPSEITPAEFSLSGMLLKMDSDDGPDLKRMYMPFFFSYPDKAVSVGDTWKYSDSTGKTPSNVGTVIEYKVVEETKLKNSEVLKVSASLKEKGNEMSSDGHFWLDRKGNIVKYQFSVEGWYVPMAGQAFNAEISGELVD